MTISMLDAGVINLGKPNAFPVELNVTEPWKPPEVERYGFSNVLFNNVWGTNYVMWQPYRRRGHDLPEEASYAFRYELFWEVRPRL